MFNCDYSSEKSGRDCYGSAGYNRAADHTNVSRDSKQCRRYQDVSNSIRHESDTWMNRLSAKETQIHLTDDVKHNDAFDRPCYRQLPSHVTPPLGSNRQFQSVEPHANSWKYTHKDLETGRSNSQRNPSTAIASASSSNTLIHESESDARTMDMSQCWSPLEMSRSQRDVGEEYSSGQNSSSAHTADKSSNRGDYYCEVCRCETSGPKAFQSHINGTRHKKNLKHRAAGRLINKGRSGKSSSLQCDFTQVPVGQAIIMPVLKKSKEALIGLQLVTEYQKPDTTSEPHYVCSLCESVCDPRNLLAHLTGWKHRLNYMKEYYPSYYEIVIQRSQKKSDQMPLVEEYAHTIDCEEGRQEIMVKQCTEELPGVSKVQTKCFSETVTPQGMNKRNAPEIDLKSKRFCGDGVFSTSDQCGSDSDSFLCSGMYNSSYDYQPQDGARCTQSELDEDWVGRSKTESSHFRSDHDLDERCYVSGPESQQRKSDYYTTEQSQNSHSWTSNYGGGGESAHYQQRSTGHDRRTDYQCQPQWNGDHGDGISFHGDGLSSETPFNVDDGHGTGRKCASSDNCGAKMTNNPRTTAVFGRFLEEMASCVVKSEEDAKMALQVSNTLTKALMNYRMRDLSRKLENNAIKKEEERYKIDET